VIPISYLQEWTAAAPWSDLRQVEQDLIICRALCDLFNDPFLATRIAFRGGTAIHKLLFQRPLRYSEDIDLIQTQAEPIGPTIDAIRKALSWLGRCRTQHAEHSIHLVFRFTPEVSPEADLKLEVEMNTREHESLYGVRDYPFEVESSWYRGKATIRSFTPEELFGTKLRALLQRRKSRDLFDLGEGLGQLRMEPDKLIASFEHYLGLQGVEITRARAEERMLEKLNRSLTEDITPLLPAGVTFTDRQAIEAFERVWRELISRIKGEPWKLSARNIEKIRTAIPGFMERSSG
jgi:predicted nucleotidyltransferase component of viral defense system